MKQCKERFKKYPKVAQFNEGKEFYNVGVKQLFSDYNVEYFSRNSDRKAAIVERFNRTLKTSMWKYFYSKGTYNWIDILDKLVNNYNHNKHSSILMKPADVNFSNQNQVWITLYGYGLGDFPLPKFKIGDEVRISKYKNIFTKGYEAKFAEEIFKIIKVFRGDPNMYEIKDLDGEPIIKKFYEQDLSTVQRSGKYNIYKVEKIFKSKKAKRKNMVLVKWLSYDNKHNSWIPEENT